MTNFRNCGQHGDIHRRHFLLGAAGAAGFHLLKAHADAEEVARGAATRKTARACIFINLSGAPSHLDTFDPKDGPWNPPDVDLQQHPGGIVLSARLFPKLSGITNDLCLLHSVQSWEAAHERGQFYLQTSHPSNPAFAQETPHIGAVIARELGNVNQPLPPFLAFYSSGMQGQAFLGGRMAPLTPAPNRAGLATLEHNYYGAQSRARFEQKFALLEALDAPLRKEPFDSGMAAYASFYGSAKQMMYNDQISQVFRYTADDEGRYGNTNIGRSLIVARNAIKARNGAVFVNTMMGGWDTHQQMFDTGYTPNMYQLTNDLDRAVGALVEDLKASGDFQQTLICMMGEFGRTPGNLNARGGRDHHKSAMCATLLGGGVKGGRAIGSTTPDGANIDRPGWRGDRPIFMEDIASTILSALGIDWTKSITDTPSGRKFEYVPYAADGTYFPVDDVFG
ncbi:MAG: DUF1501 domain-containing protein [Acidobacteria bacterium]|nr:DUF1501 domain-containing protein [Acidobacteriota bacterium]